jgi:hypothetical protein
MHCAQLLECRWRWEALVPSARCGGGERRAGGGGHRRATQAQGPPSTRHRIGCLACVPPPPSQRGGLSDQKGCPSLRRAHSISAHSIRTEDLGELKVERRFRYIIFDSSQVTSSHNRSLARSAIWRATRGVFPLDMIPLCPPGRGPRAKARPAPQAHILLVLRDRIRSNRPTGRRRF